MSRTLILHPALNPSSFVLLFTKGDSGRSWSVRDYSIPNIVKIRYAREFPFSISDLHAQTVLSLEAPSTSTANLEFWHRLILETSTQHNLSIGSVTADENNSPDRAFPVYQAESLMALPKGRKIHDMRRILSSPRSEDWVTWNAFALVQDLAPHTWWKHLVHLATQYHPQAAANIDSEAVPHVSLWRSLSAPKTYEAAHRAHMRTSSSPSTVARSFNENAVEGESEIDIVVELEQATVFIEAKLGSDISARTTHDPSRNQIIRNIDCLLEVAGDSTPYFWMLVRDRGEMRSYQQLLDAYRRDPSSLIEVLPHRDPKTLIEISQRLCSILWKDFVSIIPEPSAADDHAAIYHELMVRVQ